MEMLVYGVYTMKINQVLHSEANYSERLCILQIRLKKSFDLIGKEMVSLQSLATAVVLYIWTSRIHNADPAFPPM